jgi:hypothetical protein
LNQLNAASLNEFCDNPFATLNNDGVVCSAYNENCIDGIDLALIYAQKIRASELLDKPEYRFYKNAR